MERTVRAPDGRTLAVQDAGDLAGRPVLVHAGTPMSRRLYCRNVADAAGRGLRLIGYDRPGYGGSTPQPGRTVADCAGDVRAICAALGIGRLAMWGLSGGGPHVLACAALLPDLVTAAAGARILCALRGRGPGLVRRHRPGCHRCVPAGVHRPGRGACRDGPRRQENLATPASDLPELFASFLAPADAAALTGELAGFITATNHEALAPGSQGWWDDIYALVHPWGFKLTGISVPVLLLHGRQDKFIPFGHGQWLAANIPQQVLHQSCVRFPGQDPLRADRADRLPRHRRRLAIPQPQRRVTPNKRHQALAAPRRHVIRRALACRDCGLGGMGPSHTRKKDVREASDLQVGQHLGHGL